LYSDVLASVGREKTVKTKEAAKRRPLLEFKLGIKLVSVAD
jgi:hypothetical protein